MKLKLTLHANGRDVDLVATVDASVTVGDLARHLALADPMAVRAQQPAGVRHTLEFVDGDRQLIDPRATVGDSGLRAGSRVRLAWAGELQAATRAVLDLVAREGVDRGRAFPVTLGTSYIGRGRGCEVQLADPLASRHHARLVVTDVVEIVDLGSANGTLMGGQPITRARLVPGDEVHIGDTVLTARWKDEHHEARVSSASNGVLGFDGGQVRFSRSPRVQRTFEPRTFPLPELPERPRRNPLPWLMAVLPLMFAGVLVWVTGSLTSLLFMLMMPLLLMGTAFEARLQEKRQFKQAMAEFAEDVGKIAERVRTEQQLERQVRQEEHPAFGECYSAVGYRSPLLWTRRLDGPHYLELRVGLGALASRCVVEMPTTVGRSRAEAWLLLEQSLTGLDHVDDVPVVVRPLVDGAIGIAGDRRAILPVAYSLVVQAMALHSPAELAVAAVASSKTATDWDLLKWAPHVSSPHSPVAAAHLAATELACIDLVDQLEELIDDRSGTDATWQTSVLLIVEGDAPIERSRLVELAERGRGRGLAVLWLAEGQPRLPAACATYVLVEGEGAVGYVRDATSVTPVRFDTCDAGAAATAARLLAPVIDAGVPSEDASDLPRSVSLLTLSGVELADSPSAVIERWTESRSILTGPYAATEPSRRPANLRALIGASSLGAFSIDLRADGPHALVGGTTGAGKSELLQSWILGMAAAHSPQRVTFLLVDYKGGSAFRECNDLPHTVGVVTDLTPHLVRRALISLSAELRYREHLLAKHKAKDLIELERRGVSDTPPSLVIVVDEFAALVQEVPDFVDGVVNVAQRGRSLGLHLILATQRPTGVIRGNLRANTNLRLALRMADEDDSEDVLGSPEAAFFDPAIPGRAVSKSGPGRLTSFQAGYAGGWTSAEPPPQEIAVHTLVFGAQREWELQEPVTHVAPDAPTDIQRLVGTIGKACHDALIPPPRVPWKTELHDTYDLRSLEASRRDDELALARIDIPEDQDQPTYSYKPDEVGNLAVFGVSGSGKSAFLRSVAVAAGYTIKGGPCQVYGLDFGNRGLEPLTPLPHVGSVILGTDHERVMRLITHLEGMIERRAVAWSKVNAGTIVDYRRLADAPTEPRIFVLLDGLAAFRQAYEVAGRFHWIDRLGAIAGAGRQLGIHLVVSVDQRNGVPSPLAPVIQGRIVLRMSDEDCTALGEPDDVFTPETPPGRGLSAGHELQIAVLGGSSDPARQARDIATFAAAMRRNGIGDAPSIESLAERVGLRDLLQVSATSTVLGVASSTLAPQAFQVKGTFLVTGPSGSGRTTALRTMCIATRRGLQGAQMHLFTARATSPVAKLGIWSSVSVGPAQAIEQARVLAEDIRGQGSEGDAAVVVVFERLDDVVADGGEFDFEALVKACLDHDHFVIAEADAQFFSSNDGLNSRLKTSRTGVILHPEGTEGYHVFRVDVPTLDRADLPPGRGFYVSRGAVELVQVAIP